MADENEDKKYRVFQFSTQLVNAETGEKYIDEQTILGAIYGHKSIKKWAYILHDKDVYADTPSDKEQAELKGKGIGDPKPAHYHCVIHLPDSPKTIKKVAEWFNLPEHMIQVVRPGGEKGFMDVVSYFPHIAPEQQAQGKTIYEYSDIHTNIEDVAKAIEDHLAKRSASSKNKSVRDYLRHQVLREGMTLKQAEEYDPIVFAGDLLSLQRLRGRYLMRQPNPIFRINYYIEGIGGQGKGVSSKALARLLTSSPYDMDDDEIFFEVGGNNVAFNRYDGQPVIIWNDVRPNELIRKFGRDEVFDTFDSYPTSATRNIKYSEVRLLNHINIVNGVIPYKEFLDGLAGEYTTTFRDGTNVINKAEDKSQVYRRFPIILCVREEDFDVLMNKGVVSGTREYEQYETVATINGSFREIANKLSGEARRSLEDKMLKPVEDTHSKVVAVFDPKNKIEDVGSIPKEFENYGVSKRELLAPKIEHFIAEVEKASLVPEDLWEDWKQATIKSQKRNAPSVWFEYGNVVKSEYSVQYDTFNALFEECVEDNNG